MRNVLADLALESEAATTLGAAAGRGGRPRRSGATRASGRSAGSPRPSASTGSASGSRRSSAEALECLGGNGYVEDSGMPRLYRDAPLNSIWEGSGNVQALDVLRALGREPGTAGRPARRGGPGAWRRPPPGRGGRPAAPPSSADPEHDRAAGPAARRADGAGAAGLPAGAARTRGGRRRVLRDPAGRRRRPRVRHAARAAPTSTRSSSGRCRKVPEAWFGPGSGELGPVSGAQCDPRSPLAGEGRAGR